MSGASTGGMASGGPAADGRPSMAASAFATSASPKSASDGESPAPGPAGVILSKNLRSSTGTGMTRALLRSEATSTTAEQPQLQRGGVAGHHVGRCGQPLGGLVLAVGGDDPGPALTLGLASACRDMDHFMASGSETVFDLHPLDPDAPRALSQSSSMMRRSSRLTGSRSESSWSISDWPMIERRDVCAC